MSEDIIQTERQRPDRDGRRPASPPDKPTTYPKLAAIVTAAATLSGWSVHDRAIRAHASELLPTVLGGKRRRARPSLYGLPLPVYDHAAVFHRRGIPDRAIVAQPYDDVIKSGELGAEAQALADRGMGLWVSHELSSWLPGRTVLVLVAAGLTPERAPLLGFLSLAEPGA